MDLQTIRQLAEEFRAGIENAINSGAISPRTTRTTLPYFPDGCCELASELLAQYFLENDITTRCIFGEYCLDCGNTKFPHSWLETEDGCVIDITEDQFLKFAAFAEYSLVPCYVGGYDKFHRLFSDHCRNDGFFRGLDKLGDNYTSFARPTSLYRIILQHMP